MKSNPAFTLIEIMITLAIVSLLAAIAIPNLLRTRMNAYESMALTNLKVIRDSANSYRSANTSFPANLSMLAASNPPYIDSLLSNGDKQGYLFSLTGSTYTFSATARPKAYNVNGNRSFYVDQEGVIKYTSTDTAAISTDPTID